MKAWFWMGVVAVAMSGLATAQAPQPDGWTIGFAWSPEYCKRNLGIKEPQCQQEHYFALSGLAPRYEPGHASADCLDETLPKELQQRALEALPNATQLKKTWRREGACSGLAPGEYVLQLERAGRRLMIPERFRQTPREVQAMPLAEFKAAFIQDNPGLPPEALMVGCRRDWLDDVRVCVDGAFEFQACPSDVRESCSEQIRIRPLRSALRRGAEAE